MGLALMTMMMMASCSRTGDEQQARSISPDPASCSVVASIPYWDQARAIRSFERNVARIDHLSLFWYHLDPAGKIQTYQRAHESQALVRFAQKHGVKVLGLIANLPDDEREGRSFDWDAERVRRNLHSKARRTTHIADILALVRRMNLDGVLIDYEALPGDLRQGFTDFIAELGRELRIRDRLLAVAVHPKTSEQDSRENNGSRAQDWNALEKHADQLHFMTYSQHVGPQPGPVAAAPWVDRVLRYAVEERKLPTSKVFVGLPLYGEQWTETAPGQYRGLDVDLTFADVQRLARDHGAAEEWSQAWMSPSLTYRDAAGSEQIVWFENRRSSQAKLALARKLGLCNLALWRLGGEDPGFWSLLGAGAAPGPGRPVGGSGVPAMIGGGDAVRRGGEGVKDADADGKGDRADKASGEDGEPTASGGEDGEPSRGDQGPAPEGDGARHDRDGETDGARSADAPEPRSDDDQGSAASSGSPAAAAAAMPVAARTVPGSVEGASARAPAAEVEREEDAPPGWLDLGASGELSGELQYYNRFAATQPARERDNWISNIHLNQTVRFTEHLSLESGVRTVLESDGEDRRFYSDFRHEGIYLRNLLLRYQRERFSVFAGKYEPANGLRGQKPIFFGNYSTDLELEGRLGGGASLTLGEGALGKHTLTGHWFRRDPSRLRGEIITDEPRDYDVYGGRGDYGAPDSYLASLDGSFGEDNELGAGYALVGGMQKRAEDFDDEAIFLAVLNGRFPLGGEQQLRASLEGMVLQSARSLPQDVRSAGLGIIYSRPRLNAGATYSIRFVDLVDTGEERTDRILELVTRFEATRSFVIEAAYQHAREWGVVDNALGISLRYLVDWQL